MRVENILLLCIAGLLTAMMLAAAVSAQDNKSRDFSLDFYNEYCNCDDECGGFSSCLSETTDDFIKAMSSLSDSRIEEAEEAGYRGICTAVSIDSEPMVYSMTPECSEPEPPAEEGDNKAGTESEDTGDSGESISSNVTNRIITVHFTDDEDENESRHLPGMDTNINLKKITGGFSMDILTAGIISGTVVLVGFFGLMAWIAYLLQQKSVEKGKK